MKVIVTQTGARRGYAVPRILAQSGLLERFYTDICGNVGLGHVLAHVRVLPVVRAPLTRLAKRQVPFEVLPYTSTFEKPWIRNTLLSILTSGNPEVSFRRQISANRAWARQMLRAGFGTATHVYSMLSEGGLFLRQARRSGLKVISEVYILISTEHILEKERMMFPTWEPDQPNWPELRKKIDTEDHLLNDVDYYICPSEAVRNDLVQNWGVNSKCCYLVPYGMDPHWLDIKPAPVQGRVLFVGTAELRKGIHYLAMAASILAQRGKKYEFRVAGHVSNNVRNQSDCRFLHFLGRVPRDEIHEEFQAADIFVLPSLAEGSAEVTYEALGAGLPLVVTEAAGSVIRDGIEGCIVSERDPEGLADTIERIIDNRQMRDRLACAARERARDFTWGKYGERLLAALRTIDRS